MNETLLHRFELQEEFVNKIVNDIPENVLQESDCTIYEPECAGAQFSVESVNRLRNLGFSKKDSLKRVYCSSQSKIPISFAKTKGLQNYYLDKDLPDMKFTVNINNFPYGNSDKSKKMKNAGGSNGTPLYSKLLAQTCDITDKLMLTIAPAAVANLDGKTLPAMRKKGFHLKKVEFGMEKYFPMVKTQIGYFVFTKEKHDVILVNNIEVDLRDFNYIPNLESKDQLDQIKTFISPERNGWKYLDNRHHHKVTEKEKYLVVRRMYNKSDSFAYHRGLDMNRFDKESVLGLYCPDEETMEKWIQFLESDNARLLRKTSSYCSHVSTHIIGYVKL